MASQACVHTQTRAGMSHMEVGGCSGHTRVKQIAALRYPFTNKVPRLIYSFVEHESKVTAETYPLPLIPSSSFFFSESSCFLSISLLPIFILLSHFILSLSRSFHLLSTRSSFASFVHAAWVSQMEWLEAMAVMQNTVQMNAGLPQGKKKHAHKHS